ncbi:MAG: GNAT family N-acetyltransferase [Alphaproteobacteria bacterium]
MISQTEETGSPSETSLPILEGYRAGLIGEIVTMHAETYSRWAGFGSAFECTVARGLADFVTRLERPANGLWRAEREGRLLGSIAIDGEDLGDGSAHLRWFIVDPACRGAGLGQRLLEKALDFTDRSGATETRLWTLKGLEAARILYERAGFVLAKEYDGDQWGTPITEQIFLRRRGGSR